MTRQLGPRQGVHLGQRAAPWRHADMFQPGAGGRIGMHGVQLGGQPRDDRRVGARRRAQPLPGQHLEPAQESQTGVRQTGVWQTGVWQTGK